MLFQSFRAFERVLKGDVIGGYYQPYSCFFLAKIALNDGDVYTAKKWLQKINDFREPKISFGDFRAFSRQA